MNPYRSGGRGPGNERRLVMSPLGAFGIGVWCGLTLVTGAVIIAAWAGGSREPVRLSGILTGVGVTLGATLLVGVILWVLDPAFAFVARIDDGLLVIETRPRFGRAESRTFAFRDIVEVSVDEHGEDDVATFVSTKKKTHAVFVTRIGDDARRVQAFVEEAIAAWGETQR